MHEASPPTCWGGANRCRFRVSDGVESSVTRQKSKEACHATVHEESAMRKKKRLCVIHNACFYYKLCLCECGQSIYAYLSSPNSF